MKRVIFIVTILFTNCQKQLSQENANNRSVERSTVDFKDTIENYIKNNGIGDLDDVIIDNEYLDDFFSGNKYALFKMALKIDGKKVFFAVHYIETQIGIWDKLLGFTVCEGRIKEILIYDDYRFSNAH